MKSRTAVILYSLLVSGVVIYFGYSIYKGNAYYEDKTIRDAGYSDSGSSSGSSGRYYHK